MANFEIIYPTLIKYEGYYANIPTDKGGETYMGVSRVYNPTWAGWKIVDAYKNNYANRVIPYNTRIPSAELEALVKIEAKRFFSAMYGEQINSTAIATIAAQLFWGSSDGIKYVIQRAAKNLGAKISLDNVLGTETVKAINKLPEPELYAEVKKLYKSYFTTVGNSQPEFKEGWLNRVNYVISFTDKLKLKTTIPLVLIVASLAVLLLRK